MYRFSAMKMIRLLLLPLMAFVIAGCATREGALRSRNVEYVHIEAEPERINAVARKVFAAHGFQPAPESNPQALQWKKKTPLLFRPVKGGDAFVWLILEPRASGWDAYCLPEPDRLYPGGNAPRFRKVLTEIKDSAEAPPERN